VCKAELCWSVHTSENSSPLDIPVCQARKQTNVVFNYYLMYILADFLFVHALLSLTKGYDIVTFRGLFRV
jgi:hypothetical protein